MDFWTYTRTVDEDFAATVRAFIEANYPADRLEHHFTRPFDREFNQKFKVWQEAHLADANPQVAAFRREADRYGIDVSGMNSTSMVAKTLAAIGTEAQKRDLLPKVDSGEVIFALGYTEPESGSDAAAAKTRAVRSRLNNIRLAPGVEVEHIDSPSFRGIRSLPLQFDAA